MDAGAIVKMLEALLSGRFYARARVQWHAEPVFEGLMQDTVVAPVGRCVTQCVLAGLVERECTAGFDIFTSGENVVLYYAIGTNTSDPWVATRSRTRTKLQ